MNFEFVFDLWPMFLKGTMITVVLTVSVVIISTPLAFSVALFRDSNSILIRVIFAVCSWITRGIPPLLLLLIVFFVPSQFGLKMPSLLSAIIAMSLYMCFYYGEVFRGGLAAISKGQYEAANALGLSKSRTFSRIILPQLCKPALAPYMSHTSTLLKNTALASAIAVPELTGLSRDIFAVTYRPFETLIIVAAIYGLISVLIFYIQHTVENSGFMRSMS